MSTLTGYEPVVVRVDREYRQRLETAVRICQMLAHRLNNSVGGIGGVAQLMRRRLGGEAGPLNDYVAMILSEVTRCAAVTEDLRRLWERPTGRHGPLAIDELLSEALPHGAQAAIDVRASCLAIQGDGPMLRSAISGLVANSIEAGASRVSLEACREPNGCITISVEDDGEGFSARALQTLGEPVSSARRGHGGLGLTLALLAADDHGGHLEVAPGSRGAGSRVSLVLGTRAEVLP
jgi:signal transduction histidine kinase